jgi:hypothetical protein
MLLQYEGIFELSWVGTCTFAGCCLNGIFENGQKLHLLLEGRLTSRKGRDGWCEVMLEE